MTEKKQTVKFGIRQKVLTILVTVLLTAISISGWLALQEEKENYVKETRQRGEDISRYVAKSLSFSVIGYDYHTIQLLLDSIVSANEIKYAEVLNQQQKTMGKAGKYSADNNGDLIIFSEKIMLEENIVGTLILALSTEQAARRLESQTYSLITREAIIIILIALGEFIALSFIIIKPVNVITRSMEGALDKAGRVV